MGTPAVILTQIASVVRTLTGYRESPDRFDLEKEPAGGADKSFSVQAAVADEVRDFWGTNETRRNAIVSVQVAYYRAGGLRGNRLSVNELAADDMARIGDECELPSNYNQAVTGINTITFSDWKRVFDGKVTEIWECRMDVLYEEVLAP